MGKSSKANKKKDQQQQQKKEASWEEQQPLKEFFQIKEVDGSAASGGVSVVRHPTVHAPASVRRGTGGMCHMNYKTFEKVHLEHAKEQQEEPLAFLIHGTAVQFHQKFPQIPEGRFVERDWPTKDPLTGAEHLRSGIILQMGKGQIDLIMGQADFKLERTDTLELIAEWDEQYSPELKKLFEDKEFAEKIRTTLKKKVMALDTSIQKVYGVKHITERNIQGKKKKLQPGKRMAQAIFRLSVEKTGLAVGHTGGIAPKSGKSAIFLRHVTRPGKKHDTGTEEVWMPDGLALEEVASKATAVKGNAGLIRNQRGLGIRIYREHIAHARQTLLKDDDRIDEHTAQVLIRVQHEVRGAHVDTPLLSISRALRAKGWNTIPLKSRTAGDKRIVTVGAETSPAGRQTYRIPEGFLVVGPPIEKRAEKAGAVRIEGDFWGDDDVEEISTTDMSINSLSMSSLSGASASSGASFLGSSDASASVQIALRVGAIEGQLEQELEQMQLDRKHEHRSLEAWCQQKFDEMQQENKALHSRITETQKATEKAITDQKASIDTTTANVAQMSSNIALLLEGMNNMQARLPSPAPKRPATEQAEGDPGAAITGGGGFVPAPMNLQQAPGGGGKHVKA